MQARPPIDDRQYGRILSRMCPRPIRNEGELEQAIARLDDLDRRDQDLTPEERELARSEEHTSELQSPIFPTAPLFKSVCVRGRFETKAPWSRPSPARTICTGATKISSRRNPNM